MITINRGDAPDIPVEITYESDGSAYNLTGKTVFFTVKNIGDTAANDDAALITKDIISHSAPTLGQTTISLTADNTNLAPGVYKYDIQIEGSDNKPISINQDKFIVNDDVTKRRYTYCKK